MGGVTAQLGVASESQRRPKVAPSAHLDHPDRGRRLGQVTKQRYSLATPLHVSGKILQVTQWHAGSTEQLLAM